MTSKKIGAIVLASGLSLRFKAARIDASHFDAFPSKLENETAHNKLLVQFNGKMVAEYSAACITQACIAQGGIQERIAVLPPDEPVLCALYENYGYTICINENPHEGQGASLRLGVKAILARRVDMAFVCLADMPLITTALLENLMAQLRNHDCAICGTQKRFSPPALFPKRILETMLDLEGDRGARAILHTLKKVAYVDASTASLHDIDRPEDLEKTWPK